MCGERALRPRLPGGGGERALCVYREIELPAEALQTAEGDRRFGVDRDLQRVSDDLRDRGEARRPDLPASGDAAPGRRQGLLRAL